MASLPLESDRSITVWPILRRLERASSSEVGLIAVVGRGEWLTLHVTYRRWPEPYGRMDWLIGDRTGRRPQAPEASNSSGSTQTGTTWAHRDRHIFRRTERAEAITLRGDGIELDLTASSTPASLAWDFTSLTPDESRYRSGPHPRHIVDEQTVPRSVGTFNEPSTVQTTDGQIQPIVWERWAGVDVVHFDTPPGSNNPGIVLTRGTIRTPGTVIAGSGGPGRQTLLYAFAT